MKIIYIKSKNFHTILQPMKSSEEKKVNFVISPNSGQTSQLKGKMSNNNVPIIKYYPKNHDERVSLTPLKEA